MEAVAIEDEPESFDDLANVDETVCDRPLPTGFEEAVVERASGSTWAQVAKRAGVCHATIHRWRQEYPFDAMVSQVIRDTTSEGMLLLSSKFKRAAKVVADYVEGDIEGESTEKGVSYSKAQLRFAAAKEAMGRVMRAWEYSEQIRQGPHAKPQGRDLTDEEAVAVAREAYRRLGKGK